MIQQIFREQKSFDDSFKSEVNNNESKSKLRPSNYIIIGRNINQWRNSIDYKFVLKDSYSHQSHSTTTTPILPTTNLPVHSSSMSSVQSPKLVNFSMYLIFSIVLKSKILVSLKLAVEYESLKVNVIEEINVFR